MIHSYTTNIEELKNTPFLESLMEKAQDKSFFNIRKIDTEFKSESHIKLDIGIFAMIFWTNAKLLLVRPKSIDFINKYFKDAKEIISISPTHVVNKFNRKKEMTSNYINLHVNQFLISMYILKMSEKFNDKQNEIEKMIEKLKIDSKTTQVAKFLNNKSFFQNEVEWLLRTKIFKNLAIEQEYKIAPYSADFYIKEYNLIVECHGNQHYKFGSKEPRLPDKIKIDILNYLEYKVLIIPVNDWNQLQANDKEKYLRDNIKNLGVHISEKFCINLKK